MPRYPVHGDAPASSEVTVYDHGTLNASEIYEEFAGGSPLVGGVVGSSATGKVVFFVDSDTYPVISLFDLKISKALHADILIYKVWNYFNAVSLVDPSLTPGTSPYTLADMRTRLATFYSLDEDDVQVKAMLNECIQTGYEKVVSTTNMHSKEADVSADSVVGQIEYSVMGMGIPTYVGYKGQRLQYLPYDTLRERYGNFGTGWNEPGEDPVYYSLKGFDGVKKTLVIVPAPKEVSTIYILCLQNPGVLSLDSDYPLVPQDWQWLVLERAKIERTRFLGDIEFYKTQAQEFVAYVKVMLNRLYPATPEPEHGFVAPAERSAYNNWRSNRS